MSAWIVPEAFVRCNEFLILLKTNVSPGLGSVKARSQKPETRRGWFAWSLETGDWCLVPGAWIPNPGCTDTRISRTWQAAAIIYRSCVSKLRGRGCTATPGRAAKGWLAVPEPFLVARSSGCCVFVLVLFHLNDTLHSCSILEQHPPPKLTPFPSPPASTGCLFQQNVGMSQGIFPSLFRGKFVFFGIL